MDARFGHYNGIYQETNFLGLLGRANNRCHELELSLYAWPNRPHRCVRRATPLLSLERVYHITLCSVLHFIFLSFLDVKIAESVIICTLFMSLPT